ncbi:thiolase family protein [Haloglomus litoreum]|uniref:thiolase family protein n=1 Tax=Haloglomus litoreum TaxID=3034026 RepID=UPI0023E85E73|nr:thiolase family protein [Haloglomus sp. DT116]
MAASTDHDDPSDTDPVVVAARRTPQGKQGGVYADTRSEDLSVAVVNELLAESGLSGEHVDDLQWGCAKQVKEQGNNLARVVTLLSDLGESVPGTTIDRLCGSSAQAIAAGADHIRAGQRDVIIAGGVENMSRVERDHGIDSYPGIRERYDTDALAMGQTAETVAERFDVSREAQDAYGARSQQRAVAATEAGRFDDEIVPIETADGVITEDEGLRPGTTAEKLADLPTVFREDGTVTPGNASQISDGAAGVLLASRAFAEEHDLPVLAEVGAHDVAGVDPEIMGIGPVPAVRGLMERAGTAIDDYDLVELNEAFASQTLYCQRELGIEDERFNVNGGAIAIGHPLGASGARLPTTLIHELRRRGGGRGLSTMCIGYGQGIALEFAVP